MKKALTILTLMALGVSTAYGGIFMVEDYTEDTLDFPTPGTYKLASVTFQLDQFSIATVVTGGERYGGSSLHVWLVLDENSLGTSICRWYETPSFMMELETGIHTLDFMIHTNESNGGAVNPRLQVLVLYNDAPSVSETPPNITPIEISTILSQGPSVTVPGCSEVVDIAGRKVDCEVNDDRIMVNSLSSGTYIARGSEGRITKIVKLK